MGKISRALEDLEKPKKENDTKPTLPPMGRRKRNAFLLVTVISVIGVTVFFSLSPAREGQDIIYEKTNLMPVSIQRIKPEEREAVVSVYGVAQPLWKSAIKAQVEGAIVYCSPQLQVGSMVKKGELMVRIGNPQLKMQVAEAKSHLASARLELFKEESEAREARKNWSSAGIADAPASPLVLRKPQLENAHAQVEAAKSALSAAETQWGYTEIRSPIDGVVIRRSVNPGENLIAGDEVVTIFGVAAAEVEVKVDAKQWALLDDHFDADDVQLTDPERKGVMWPARVVRASWHLDENSRLRILFLQVDQPLAQTPPLLPGTFVRAEIRGRKIDNLLRLPESAITQQGLVWFVDHDNRLRSRLSQPVIYEDSKVYIRNPLNERDSLQVAILPNASYTNGQHVMTWLRSLD